MARQRSSLGSIHQLPDRRYKVTITVGYYYDGNGKKKQKRRSRIVNSMKEARELLRQYNDKSVKRIKLRNLIEEYYEVRKLRPSTRRMLNFLFRKCLAPLYDDYVDNIKAKDIDDILDSLEMAETTAHMRRGRIQILFNYAKKNGYISEVPDLKERGNLSATKTMKILPSMQEMQALLEKAKEYKKAPYLYYVMLLILATGIRVGEACALKWKNIDFDNNTISIIGTITRSADGYYYSNQTKTEESKRIIPINRDVLEIINTLPHKSEYVFRGIKNSFLKPGTITGKIRIFFNENGYNQLRLYDLRHIHATQLLAHGVDVKSVSHRLGHSSPVTTLKTYIHYVSENDRKAADLMGDLVLKKCLSSIKERKKP